MYLLFRVYLLSTEKDSKKERKKMNKTTKRKENKELKIDLSNRLEDILLHEKHNQK